MAMNGDGKTAYDKDNDGKANEIAGCSVRVCNLYDRLLKANVILFRPAEFVTPKFPPKLD